MKRNIFTLLILISAVVAVSAQTPLNTLSWNKMLLPQKNNSAQQIRDDYQNRFHNQLRNPSYWVSYALDYDALNGYYFSSLSGNFLFPDSNVYVNFSDGAGGIIEGTPFVHELGDILDPLAFVFQYIDGVNFTTETSYTVDSALIYMAYQRTTDASIVDTLLVYMYEGAVGASNLPEYYYVGPDISANFGYDTLFIPFMKYSYTTNKPNATNLKTFKLPLYESDSSSFYFAKVFSTNNFSIPANHKVAMAVTFKPGYSYDAFDNVEETGNVMFFASYEENGLDTYPTYYPDEHNVSSIIPTSVRYNIDQSGYNGLFIPAYAYTSPYSFERHLFAYHITDNLSGVNDLSDNISSFNITPNPATDFSRIDYSLSKLSNVTISIYDVTGKLLSSMNEGLLSSGSHFQMLDVSKLNAGVYMVAIESNEVKTTQKLIVAK